MAAGDFSLRDKNVFVNLTSLMKSLGYVLVGRDNGSWSGALRSWMKEVLSSSRRVSLFAL